jgi:hypothetical protein
LFRCSAPAHLSPRSGPSCNVQASRPLCPVLVVLIRLTCQADMFKLTCLGCPVQHHT